MNLFGLDIARIVADSIAGAGGVLDATLTVLTPGTRTGGLTGGTNPTSVNYACKGFIDRKQRRNRDGQVVDVGIETIVLLGATISNGGVSPKLGDRVLIEGTTYVIEQLDRDPAGATFTLGCRRQ